MPERTTFSFDSLPGHVFEMDPPGAFSGMKLFVNGEEIKPKKKMEVPLPDGSTAEVTMKSGWDQSPTFTCGEESVSPLPGVPGGLMVLAALPIALVFIGGLVGGLFGGLAFGINMGVARSKMQLPLRIGLMILIGIAAVVAYLVVAGLFLKAIG